MENIKYREHYLRKIEPFMGTSLIKVMTGQRRVGKSYILFQLIELIRKKESEANIIYINLEDIAFDFIKSAKELHSFQKNNEISAPADTDGSSGNSIFPVSYTHLDVYKRQVK